MSNNKVTPHIFGAALRRVLVRQWGGKRVTIMGLGHFSHGSGISSALFFGRLGARLLVTDLKPASAFAEARKKLQPYRPQYIFGKHRKSDFTQTDLVIANPVVPRNSPWLVAAREANVQVETDISFFVSHLASDFTIGVTGTRGKTTTTSLIGHILQRHYPRVHVGGNIGLSPLHFLFRIRPRDPVILELSSWMLESTSEKKWSPHIAVITSIFPDHLDHYQGMHEYLEAKKNIFRFQDADDKLVYLQTPQVEKLVKGVKAKRFPFSNGRTGSAYALRKGYFIGPKQKRLARFSDLKLQGDHNQRNALAALAVADQCKVPMPKMRRALSTYRGVPHRQELVKQVGKITYINDTTATTPDAVIAALDTFQAPIILIAGGSSKNLHYTRMAAVVKEKVQSLVLLPGPAGKMLGLELHKKGYHAIYGPFATMSKAVKKAEQLSSPGTTVLLSPGAASFSSFLNAYDRGAQFRSAVRALNMKK